MPLIKSKSKQAFEHNMKAEMDAGKPQKQSLAIAYNTKRMAKKAKGGIVGKAVAPNQVMAEGGSVKAPHEESMSTMEHYDSIAEAILAKRKKEKMLAEGGMVDIEDNGMTAPDDEDASRDEPSMVFDDDQLEAQPEDSNEMGESEETESENQHDKDMVSEVRKRMKSKKKDYSVY